MAKIVEERFCAKCGRPYEWEYILAQKLSTTRVLEVDTISEHCVHPHCTSSHSDEPNFTFAARCPHCDNLETFEYIYKKQG